MLLDEFKGLNRTSSVLEHKLSKHATHKVYLGVSKAGSWNRTQDNASSIQQTVNIPRPQVLFPDAVENRAIPFRPKLTEKPNAIVPLHLEPTTLTDTDSSGQPISTHYYEHPYEHELRAFEVIWSFNLLLFFICSDGKGWKVNRRVTLWFTTFYTWWLNRRFWVTYSLLVGGTTSSIPMHVCLFFFSLFLWFILWLIIDLSFHHLLATKYANE